MSARDAREVSIDNHILTSRELGEIEDACDMLPGEWFMRPLPEHRRSGAARAWLHPAAASKEIGISFRFSKTNNIYHVAIEHHSGARDEPAPENPYATLRAAFARCRGYVMMQPRRAGNRHAG